MSADRLVSQPDVPLLSTSNLTKVYGRHVAVAPTDFAIRAGEVVSVLGENGAGKSTFTRMLAGALRPTSGRISCAGKEVTFRSPRAALARGVALVPQETSCVPELTVAENLMLGRWPTGAGLVRRTRLVAAARDVLARLDLDIDVDRRMSGLSTAETQLVDIARALARAASVILLDEPTSALAGADVDRLLAAVLRLRRHRVGVLLVTHRLDEACAVSDRVVVFRDGHLVRSFDRAEISRAALVAALVGEAPAPVRQAPRRLAPSVPVLRLRQVSSADQDGLRGIDLTVRAGEIVGVFGRRGCGAGGLADVIVGTERVTSGEIAVNGRLLPRRRSIRFGLAAGIAYVPPDRARNGLVLCRSVAENTTLLVNSALSRFGLTRSRRRRDTVRRTIHAYDVRCRSAEQAVGELSGGNQQKVLLASRLARDPVLAVLHEPTRGVDIGSRLAIHEIVRRVAADGAAVLVISSDVEEVVELCERVVVLVDGRIVADLRGADKTQRAVLDLGGGGVVGAPRLPAAQDGRLS